MKLAFVHVSGFRGFQRPVRIEFSESFTVLDGRNGVGKSTIFDAVEFALTGTISKYLDAKSGRESVNDYLWWTGHGEDDQDEHLFESFVEVGFRDGDEHFEIRRTPLDPQNLDVSKQANRLCDPEFAPKQAIAQLCMSTIIRDEHIARLSLDLKEGDRFTLLRDAIGAVDSEEWIKRAQALSSAAAARVKTVGNEAEQATQALANAVRQIDQLRAALPAASLVSQAAERLQSALGTGAAPDRLPEIGRRRVAELNGELEHLGLLADRFDRVEMERSEFAELERRVGQALTSVTTGRAGLEQRIRTLGEMPPSSAFSSQARQLEALVNAGRSLGLRDGHCPLCDTNISHDQLEHGLGAALFIARQLDALAVQQAEEERAIAAARSALAAAEKTLSDETSERDRLKRTLDDFDLQLESAGLVNAKVEQIYERSHVLGAELAAITADLRLIDTYSLDQATSRATGDHNDAIERVRRAEARLGRARLAETRAKAIFDAARRAAADTLDQRLERVLPLMSELYKRMRPHPIWSDIEYSVRGDVQRFLKLQVGGDVNPQFVFSSGQRRATGLAFLLSVNLSIAWSRWRSILLDDPVQHVDDFRTVHLAEVLAHLCQSGRQIVCAVEDAALADLMCRRLPTSEATPGKRVTLAADHTGALAVTHQQDVPPLSRHALVLQNQPLSA